MYRTGYKEAINILVERYKNPLYSFCRRLTPEKYRVEELFQDTWLKAAKRLESYDTGQSFKTWLFTIAINTYRDQYRSMKRWLGKLKVFLSNEERDNVLDSLENNEMAVDEQVVHKELRRRVNDCIEKLDDTFRLPLVLFYYNEMSYNDIAAALNIPAGTVKSRLNAAKAKLKKMMEVEEFEG